MYYSAGQILAHKRAMNLKAIVLFTSLVSVSVNAWPPRRVDCSPCTCTYSYVYMTATRRFSAKLADCSDRNLTEIPQHLPTDLTAISLSGNRFNSSFTANRTPDLWRYTEIKSLNLARTGISALPDNLLLRSTKLEHLDVSGNELTTIRADTFIDTMVKYMYGLSVGSLTEDAFSGLANLRNLEITFRQKFAVDLPTGLFVNTKLQSIVIRAGEMGTLPDHLLSPVSVYLRHVELYLPAASTLPDRLFKVANNETSHIEHVTIEGVREINGELFNHLDNLSELRFKNITSIPADAFAGLKRLNTLDLSYNSLYEIQDRWFDDLGSGLRELDLSHNNLTRVTNMDFSNLQSVRHLDISHNLISSIHQAAFNSMEFSLITLDLSFNNLCDLPVGVFDFIMQLERLNMDHNCLHELSAMLFVKQYELRELYVQHNNLSSFPMEALSPLQMLEVLDLSNSGIVDMPADALETLTFLKSLDISNNSLVSVPLGFLASRPELNVQLDFNPLHCNCSVLRRNDGVNPRPLQHIAGTCTSPPSLRGRNIEEILTMCEMTTLAHDRASHQASTGLKTKPSDDLSTTMSARASTASDSTTNYMYRLSSTQHLSSASQHDNSSSPRDYDTLSDQPPATLQQSSHDVSDSVSPVMTDSHQSTPSIREETLKPTNNILLIVMAQKKPASTKATPTLYVSTQRDVKTIRPLNRDSDNGMVENHINDNHTSKISPTVIMIVTFSLLGSVVVLLLVLLKVAHTEGYLPF